MKSKSFILHATMILAGMLSVGCAQPLHDFRSFLGAIVVHPPGHQEHLTFLNANKHVGAGSGYILAPPDMIAVYSPQAEEVNGPKLIRPDGTVGLPLLGPVRVAGLTPREAAAKLQRELQTYYRDPYVEVALTENQSKVFYLFGEIFGGVAGGGGGGGGGGRYSFMVPVTGRDDLLSVLTRYPPTENAWLTQLKVMRPDPEDPNKNQEITIDFYRMMAMGDLRQNILLQEGDIVYVPPTPAAWIGYRVRELLQPIAPVMEVYRAPASIIEADNVYKNDDNGNDNRTNILSGIRIP